MAYRNGPNSYDCSSAVFYALRAGGFPHTSFIGNTETLFQLRGKLLTPINRSQIRAGDIFVSGVPGGSSNAYGHTGMALNSTQAIHCSSRFNGIGISSNADSSVRAYSGAPVYWFRVIGSDGGTTPTPDPDPPKEEEDEITIESVNGGKNYIDNEHLVKIFGIRMRSEIFSDVENATDLKERAKAFLADQLDNLHEVTVSVANLELVDVRYKKIRLRDVVTVQNPEMTLNGRMRVSEKRINIIQENLSDLTVGYKKDSLIDLITKGGD